MAKKPQARPLVNPERGRLTPISLGLYDDQIAFIELQTGNSFADKLRSAVDSAMNAKSKWKIEKTTDTGDIVIRHPQVGGCLVQKDSEDSQVSVVFEYFNDLLNGDNHGND